MARDHARFQTAIHSDPEFCRLDQGAQHVYFMLTLHPDLSYCGVIDYLPSRWVGSTNGLTETKIKASIRTLERAKFVVVDRKTSELLIRSFIRNDNVLAKRNMGHACGRAIGNVHSPTLRDAVLHEIARLWDESPNLQGFAGLKDFDPIAFDMACAMSLAMTSRE